MTGKQHFNSYLDYKSLCERLQSYQASHPQLIRIQAVGKSHEGREIQVATLGAFEQGNPDNKPAMWIDANIHAAELSGSMACLYFIEKLLDGYGKDAEITRCLDSRTFYICPRVNPDGAEWALSTPPRIVRSSTRPYPYTEEPLNGLLPSDVDGDGRVLSMRVADPNGPWKKHPDEPRLMIPREPTECDGEYYRLLPEGEVLEFDGITIPLADKRERLDLNRNFPVQWKGEHEQEGAGAYPASEPEVRSLVDFIVNHKNICSVIAFHSYSGVLLRPYSFKPDEDMIPEDLWVFQKIGRKGTELTGYPAVSAYHEFQYHPRHVITGALDDWFYEERGGIAWTVEIWSPQREAGIGEYRYIEWYREHPADDDLKLLKWNDEALEGKGFVNWYPFHHPQLGEVELGGWDPLFSFWNPPAHRLEQEIARFPDWLLWHQMISPCLELLDTRVERIGEDTYRISMTVQNTGWLPSHVTRKALEKKITRGVMFEILLPANAHLLHGHRRQETRQLEGRSNKPNSPFGWSGQVSDPTDERVRQEWIVHAPGRGEIELQARHERAGFVSRRLSLG